MRSARRERAAAPSGAAVGGAGRAGGKRDVPDVTTESQCELHFLPKNLGELGKGIFLITLKM